MRRLYNNILIYNNGDSSVLGSIASDFNTISKRRSVYSLNNLNWERNGSYYRLKSGNFSGVHEVYANYISQEGGYTECAELKSNYATIIGKYINILTFRNINQTQNN
ncbi:hypothetical protein, partial [Burkholderia pseudomallei]